MGNYVNAGALDWRALEGARASGISFRLANGQSGEIIDPSALRTFYTRIYYAKNKNQPPPAPRRPASKAK
jgi:hypothetical protein